MKTNIFPYYGSQFVLGFLLFVIENILIDSHCAISLTLNYFIIMKPWKESKELVFNMNLYGWI